MAVNIEVNQESLPTIPSAQTWVDSTAGGIEAGIGARGAAGKVAGALLRFGEGVLDVTLVKPLGITAAATVSTLCLTGAIFVGIFGCPTERGRGTALGLAKIAKKSASLAVLGVTSAVSTTLTGVPRYITKRCCTKCHQAIKKCVLTPCIHAVEQNGYQVGAQTHRRLPLSKRMLTSYNQSCVGKIINHATGGHTLAVDILQAAQS